MSFAFNEEHQKKFQALLPRYPHKKALVLPCLWMAQDQDGYISTDAMRYIAKILDLSPSHIYSLATFYTMFELEPIAKYNIQVCKTLSCQLCGKDEILKSIEEELGIKVGESTELFTLREVECLGACGGAPMLSINEKYHEKLTPKKTKELLRRLS